MQEEGWQQLLMLMQRQIQQQQRQQQQQQVGMQERSPASKSPTCGKQ
jgi:hypothetical protein